MKIEKNKDLTNLNTFKVGAKTKYYVEVSSEEEVKELTKNPVFKKEKIFILGGGSNILFVDDFKGLVIKNNIKGKEVLEETEDYVLIKVGAGENWHDFVEYTVENDWSGIENLALIPGTVGAAPIQNIGAYGIEIKEVIESVETINLKNGKKKVFNNKECEFSYRNSIFKEKYKDKFIVTYVVLKLSKKHKFNLNYKGIKEELRDKKPDLESIKNAVIKIRNSKLPDVKKIGTAGSFFKNPIISRKHLNKIKKLYPDVPFFDTGSKDKVKIPAGWLLESLGFKGLNIKNEHGVYKNHALVLVNFKKGLKGKKLADLAKRIKKEIKEKFNIELEEEVKIIK